MEKRFPKREELGVRQRKSISGEREGSQTNGKNVLLFRSLVSHNAADYMAHTHTHTHAPFVRSSFQRPFSFRCWSSKSSSCCSINEKKEQKKICAAVIDFTFSSVSPFSFRSWCAATFILESGCFETQAANSHFLPLARPFCEKQILSLSFCFRVERYN